MSKPAKFRKAQEALIGEASDKIAVIRHEVDEKLETMAIEAFGYPSTREDDGFGPPTESVTVTCWHCNDKYSSSEMQWAYRPRMQSGLVDSLGRGFSAIAPMWWCRNISCDGGGFGHDIHAVKVRKPKKVAA
jgi:hypothetical protein